MSRGTRRDSPAVRAGFTLIEAALATTIIAVGILALLSAMGAGTRVNRQGRYLTQAVFLAGEIREWTLQLPFRDPDPADAKNPPGPDGTDPLIFVDDLDDLMDVTYGLNGDRVRDANGQKITNLVGWTQQIQLEWRDPNSLTSPVPPGTSDVICVTVAVGFQGEELLQTSWLVIKRSP